MTDTNVHVTGCRM